MAQNSLFTQNARGAAGRRLAAAVAAIALVAAGQPAHAQAAAAPITLELNKLEPLPGAAPGCRVYMVVTNPDADPIGQLRLDLMLFGTDGVIAKRIALDLAPLPAHKTSVRLFDLAETPCDSIGKVLVSDVLACQLGKASEPTQTCLDRLQLSARGKTELTK